MGERLAKEEIDWMIRKLYKMGKSQDYQMSKH